MKRILYALLILGCLLSFTGCLARFQPSNRPQQEQEDATSNSQTNSSVTIKPDFEFEYGNGNFGNGNIHIIVPDKDQQGDSSDVEHDHQNGQNGGTNGGADNGQNGGQNGSHTEAIPPQAPELPSNPDYVYPQNCNHEFKQVSFVDSTCATEGKKVSYCPKCDTTRTETVIKKTTHTGGVATCKSLAVCTVCQKAYGSYASHNWLDATCKAPSTCSVCGVTSGGTASHYCSNESSDCTVANVCDACGYTIRAAKNHSYVSGSCSACGATDPNYVDTSKIKISYDLTSFPVPISYGTIQSCTHEIDGQDLILKIKMKRNNAGSAQSLTGYYRISDPNFKTVAKSSYSTGSLSAGASTTVTVRISGVLTKTGTYRVFLTSYEPTW